VCGDRCGVPDSWSEAAEGAVVLRRRTRFALDPDISTTRPTGCHLWLGEEKGGRQAVVGKVLALLVGSKDNAVRGGAGFYTDACAMRRGLRSGLVKASSALGRLLFVRDDGPEKIVSIGADVFVCWVCTRRLCASNTKSITLLLQQLSISFQRPPCLGKNRRWWLGVRGGWVDGPST
jgi:hypothetical protein